MKKIYLFIFLSLWILTGCGTTHHLPPVISIGVSDDGKYAIAIHDDIYSKEAPKGGTAVLWDIENKSNKILSEHANVYSAFFIPGGHQYLWQDDENIVHIQNINGSEITQFKHFTTEGQLMTEDGLYLSVTPYWQIFSGYGDHLEKVWFNDKSRGTKPLNLSVGGNYFVSSGRGLPKNAQKNTPLKPAIKNEEDFNNDVPYKSVILWDRNTLEPITKLEGNVSKTTARISPDGQWVVGGDEGGVHYMWSTIPPYPRTRLADVDGSLLVTSVHSIVFMDHGNYFLVLNHDWYGNNNPVGVFKTGEQNAKNFLYLRDQPRPCVAYYQRNLCTASAPDANILVTGQEDHGGINVYKFHPETLTLEPVWIAK